MPITRIFIQYRLKEEGQTAGAFKWPIFPNTNWNLHRQKWKRAGRKGRNVYHQVKRKTDSAPIYQTKVLLIQSTSLPHFTFNPWQPPEEPIPTVTDFLATEEESNGSITGCNRFLEEFGSMSPSPIELCICHWTRDKLFPPGNGISHFFYVRVKFKNFSSTSSCQLLPKPKMFSLALGICDQNLQRHLTESTWVGIRHLKNKETVLNIHLLWIIIEAMQRIISISQHFWFVAEQIWLIKEKKHLNIKKSINNLKKEEKGKKQLGPLSWEIGLG